MPRVPDNPDRNFSTSDVVDDFVLEDLFASPPPRLDELFDDPIVRRRVGELISMAMNRSARLPRRRGSR